MSTTPVSGPNAALSTTKADPAKSPLSDPLVEKPSVHDPLEVANRADTNRKALTKDADWWRHRTGVVLVVAGLGAIGWVVWDSHVWLNDAWTWVRGDMTATPPRLPGRSDAFVSFLYARAVITAAVVGTALAFIRLGTRLYRPLFWEVRTQNREESDERDLKDILTEFVKAMREIWKGGS